MTSKLYAIIALIVFMQFVMSGCQRDDHMLMQEWRENERKGLVSFLTSVELKKVGASIHAAFTTPQDELLQKKFGDLGFSWRPVPRINSFVLKEQRDHLRGLGFFLIRADETQPLLIQAPHGFHDTKTGEIAILLFEESNARAVSLNTAHRKHLDLAKEKQTLFAQFLEEFLKVEHSAVVLQLHGFEQAKRKTAQGQAAEIILSSGTSTPRAELHRVKPALSKYFGNGVMLYSEDVDELGGTKNSQAKAVRNKKDALFIHLELSKSIRERLYSNKEDRAILLRSVMKVLE